MRKLILLMILTTFLVSLGAVAAISVTVPNVSGVSVSSYDNVKSYTPSQAEIDCSKTGGCFDNKTNYCYSFGYIKNGTYCSENAKSPAHYVGAFVNQSKVGEDCEQNYECDTNLCSNNVCVNLAKMQHENNLAENSITNVVNDSVEDIPADFNKTSITGDAINTQNENFLSKILLFFRKIFGL